MKLCEQANVDLLSVVQVLQRRLFQSNSDASSYMKGQVDFMLAIILWMPS